MKSTFLFVNKLVIGFCIVMIVFSMGIVVTLYTITSDSRVVLWEILYIFVILSCVLVFFMIIRYKLGQFSNLLCNTMEHMMAGEVDSLEEFEGENLFDKIRHHLIQLYEVLQEERQVTVKERTELQELVSDISHQVKTPIANLKLVNAALLEQDMKREKQIEFLKASNSQLDKLDFLMQAMIKTSRLETGVITLKMKHQLIYETLAEALSGVVFGAEKKQLQIQVDCSETLMVPHDRKWTREALFNLLDNAVKYTDYKGSIHVRVQVFDMYMKLDITDTGIGIPEKQQGMIFKRFYRGENAHDTEGIGIGLYLAREIITRQGGYIKVSSEPEWDRGTTFSVFLPMDEMAIPKL